MNQTWIAAAVGTLYKEAEEEAVQLRRRIRQRRARMRRRMKRRRAIFCYPVYLFICRLDRLPGTPR